MVPSLTTKLPGNSVSPLISSILTPLTLCSALPSLSTQSLLSSSPSIPPMKLITIINPRKLFRFKKSRSSLRRSGDPNSSFSSGTTSSDFSDSSPSKHGLRPDKGSATPTSVLPSSTFSGSDLYFQLLEGFKAMDGDGDGRIRREDFGGLLGRVVREAPSEEEIGVLLGGGDGCVSLEEFEAIGSALVGPACDSEIRGAFDYFDRNQDGRITADELLVVLSTLGEGACTLEDCRRMIRGVDRSGVGFVCFEDFRRMMGEQR